METKGPMPGSATVDRENRLFADSPSGEVSLGPDLVSYSEAASSATLLEPQDFSTSGTKWGPSGTLGTMGGTVTWSIASAGWANQTGQSFFTGHTVDLSSFLPADFLTQITDAFAAWAQVANINFEQVTDGGGDFGVGTAGNIRIGGGFIDGFNEAGSVTGRAFFPPSGGAPNAIPTNGDLVFDSGDAGHWTDALLLATALHEIGHTLGLNHVPQDNPTAVMNPTLHIGLPLQPDDIAGIQSIYGTNPFSGTITGGPGNDFLKGGLGADTFAFKNPTDGVDTIADFQQGQDHILLGSNFVSEGGGPHPLSSNVHFEYGPVASTASPTILVDNLHNHQLAWDSDGNGPAASQVLANVGFADANDVTLPDTTPISLPGLNGYSVLGTGDFNHNGGVDSDIVLRNNSSGAAEIWFMGGGAIIGDYPIGNLAGYSLNGTGDFNHNGTDDMLWRNNTSGVVETWLMHDGVRTGGDVLGNLTGYTALGTGDFNQDGNTDIVWQNNTSGAAEIWFMGGGHVIGDYSIGNLGGYSLLGVGDFNGDHTSDFLWRNNFSGVTETWLMQQGVPTGGSTIGNLANYQLLATTDVNHDGTDDLVWRNIADGTTSTWVMHNGQFQNEEQSLGTIPLSTVAAGSGDFTGDGGKDLLLLNSAANTTTFLDIEYHALTASDFLIV